MNTRNSRSKKFMKTMLGMSNPAHTLSRRFNSFFFFYFFFFLSLLSIVIIILNIVVCDKFILYAIFFLIISIALMFLMRLVQNRLLITIMIILFNILISLYDNEIFEIFAENNPDGNEKTRIMLKERIIVLLQVCLFFLDECGVNFLNFLINISFLLAFKYNSLQNYQNQADFQSIFYFILYSLFFMLLILKIKLGQALQANAFGKLNTSKKFLSLFKKFIKNYCNIPIIILNIGSRSDNIIERTPKTPYNSFNFTTKISINNELKFNRYEGSIMNLDFLNRHASDLFRIEKIDDIDTLLKEMIVFSEKTEKTDGSNLKEKIGDLKEECFKILNHYKRFSNMGNSLETCIVLDAEYKLINQSENSHFLISCFPFKHQEKMKLMLAFQDITLKSEISKLKALDAYKDSVMATVTHDLRAPLQGIMGCLEVFEQMILDDQESTLLNLAKSNVYLMGSLIEDILDENQIKMGKIKLNLKEFKTKEFIKEVMGIINIIAKKQGVNITTNISETIPQTIFSDPIRLKQVLVNLMNNSLKFTPKNGIVALEAKVSSKKPKYLLFSVKDTGAGMPQDTIDKLFKPYATFEGKGGLNKQGILLNYNANLLLRNWIGTYHLPKHRLPIGAL